MNPDELRQRFERALRRLDAELGPCDYCPGVAIAPSKCCVICRADLVLWDVDFQRDYYDTATPQDSIRALLPVLTRGE